MIQFKSSFLTADFYSNFMKNSFCIFIQFMKFANN